MKGDVKNTVSYAASEVHSQNPCMLIHLYFPPNFIFPSHLMNQKTLIADFGNAIGKDSDFWVNGILANILILGQWHPLKQKFPFVTVAEIEVKHFIKGLQNPKWMAQEAWMNKQEATYLIEEMKFFTCIAANLLAEKPYFKDIQPLIQMQPRVIVRLRETLFQVSAKKQQKSKFVTTHQLRQQQLQQQLHKKTRMSPRLNKCNQEDATVKDIVTARRKT
ncbi:hypothetical protein OROGR_011856 [Orobanche gracilis]